MKCKNLLGGINRSNDTDKLMRKLEDWVLGINEVEEGEKRKREKKNKNSFGDLWDDVKKTSILIIGVTVGEKEKWAENIIKDIIAEKKYFWTNSMM